MDYQKYAIRQCLIHYKRKKRVSPIYKMRYVKGDTYRPTLDESEAKGIFID